MSNTAEVMLFSEQEIAAYDEFRAQLAELREHNEKAVFDYLDPKGNKEARSHIYKLRQTKAAVDKVRKDQKQASLDYGRRVDAQAKEIIGEIESMIEIHQKPLDEIEQREKERVTAHQRKLDELQAILDADYSQEASGPLQTRLDNLETMEPDEGMEEFTAPALTVWKRAKEKLGLALTARQKYETEQAELARLRKEQEERERKEREERIASEAAEQAKKEAEEIARREREAAEAKAKQEKEAAERRERELVEAKERAEREQKEAQERAEREKLEADARAKQVYKEAVEREARAAQEAVERVKHEAEEAKRREEQEAAKREANKKHQAKINNAAVDALVAGGMAEDQAKLAVTLIAKRQIPAVSIAY